LPDYEYIHLHCSIWTGIISVYRELWSNEGAAETTGPRQVGNLQRVLLLAPAGSLLGQNFGEIMRQAKLFSGEHIGSANLKLGSNNLRIEAEIKPVRLFFGALAIPTFIYARCQVKVYVNDALHFEHLFW
jgi:hypothetical protein